jgi:hypothetical protein
MTDATSMASAAPEYHPSEMSIRDAARDFFAIFAPICRCREVFIQTRAPA